MATTSHEWQQWAQHPQTIEFKSIIEDAILETSAAWAAQAYVGETTDLTLAANAGALGGVDALRKMLVCITEAAEGEFHV